MSSQRAKEAMLAIKLRAAVGGAAAAAGGGVGHDGLPRFEPTSTEGSVGADSGSRLAGIAAGPASATPLPQHRSDTNVGGYPLVTGEKASADASMTAGEKVTDPADVAANNDDDDETFSVSCPDGSIVQISTSDGAKSHIILGRGKYGIPSSVAHVSKRACVLRLVKKGVEDGAPARMGRYSLELVVLGSQPCRVTRSSLPNPIFAKSIAQILADGGDLCPSSIVIQDGDIIEPYERPVDWTVDEAKTNGFYHPFKVGITGTALPEGTTDEIDGAAFAEASRKIDAAAQQESFQPSLVTVGTQTTDADVSMGLEEVPAGEESSGHNEKLEKPPVTAGPDDSGEMDDGAKSTVLDKVSLNVDKKVSKGIAVGKDSLPADDVEMSEAPSSPAKQTTNADEKGPVPEAAAKDATAMEDASEGSNAEANMLSGPKPSPVANGSAEAPPMLDLSSSDESSVDEILEGEAYYEITELLESVESPGSFAVGGSCNGKLLMPGLVVDGVGTVGLPLSETQANELAKRCEEAPFGRGSETIVDKSVRNTFQLGPEHFQINNPSWKKEIEDLTQVACRGLGVQAHLKVEAQLYKLLLYEKGSFFAPHRRVPSSLAGPDDGQNK